MGQGTPRVWRAERGRAMPCRPEAVARRWRFAAPGSPPPASLRRGPQVAAEVTAGAGCLSRGKMASAAVLGSAEGKQV